MIVRLKGINGQAMNGVQFVRSCSPIDGRVGFGPGLAAVGAVAKGAVHRVTLPLHGIGKGGVNILRIDRVNGQTGGRAAVGAITQL